MKRLLSSRATVIVALPLLLLFCPRYIWGQQTMSAKEMFDIAGENVSAGVELSDPSALLLDGSYIWIADEGLMKIIVVNMESYNVLEFGRQGSGPGEFNTLQTLTRLSPNRVAVLDRFNLRVTILEVDNQKVSLVGTIPIPVVPRSICLSRGRLIVTGWHDGKLLHVLDDSGQIIDSFGEPFRTENEIRNMGLGIRSILVSNEQSTLSPLAVVVASTEFGMIRGYNEEGELVWDVTPPNFRPIDISPTPRGSGLMYRMPKEGSYHIISSMLSLESGDLLVQVATIGDEGLDHFEKLESYLLSCQDGQLSFQSEMLPRLDCIDGDTAAGLEEPDFPKVSVYQIKP